MRTNVATRPVTRARPPLTAVMFFVFAAALLARGTAFADLVKDRMEFLAGSKAPVVIEADRAEYDRKTGVYTLTDNVVVSQGGVELRADVVTLDTSTGQADAAGRVTLTDKKNVLLAESASVNFDTSLGVIHSGSIFVKKENFHITGERFERVSQDEYRVTSGSLTTCDAKTPFWKVTASDLSVRMDRDVRAKSVVLRIKDVPVLYSPYAWFPLLKPRTTGFLIPSAGYSTSEGFRMFNSFYWAPVDNFDATVNIDYRSRRGPGFGTELRWAFDRATYTRLYGFYMDDRKDKSTRYNLEFLHRQVILDRLTVKADVNLSDREFFRDLADTTLDRTQRSVDSNLYATDRWENGMAYLLTQYTLGLDLNSDLVVQRLPEAGFNIISRKIGDTPIYLDAEGAAAYLYTEKSARGGRYDLFPKLTGLLDLGGLRILPAVGYRETLYSLSGDDRRLYDEERGLFGSGVTLQTNLSRFYSVDGDLLKAVKHTIEPRVAYNYVLRRGGSRFAKFDGVDTLGRRSMVAYSLTNRFVLKYGRDAASTSMDYLTFKLSQFYDYYKDIVIEGRNRLFSSLYGEVVYMADYGLTLNTDFRYNLYSGKILSVNTDIRYGERAGRWYFVLGQRYSTDTDQTFMSPSRFDFFTPSTDFESDFLVVAREEGEKVNFLLFEAGLKLPMGWSVSGKLWYDIHAGNFRETDVSAGYESQCWGLRAEYVNRPGERKVMMMLDFKGIGAVKL